MSLGDVQQKTRERDEWLSRAELLGRRADVLERALQDLPTQLLKPDLSHLTSLGQYGFGMGEKDDRADRADKYYSESLTLQRRIKDKLEEGIRTEAVYGE